MHEFSKYLPHSPLHCSPSTARNSQTLAIKNVPEGKTEMMRATDFEFRNRWWIFALLYGLPFLLLFVDQVPVGSRIADRIAARRGRRPAHCLRGCCTADVVGGAVPHVGFRLPRPSRGARPRGAQRSAARRWTVPPCSQPALFRQRADGYSLELVPAAYRIPDSINRHTRFLLPPYRPGRSRAFRSPRRELPEFPRRRPAHFSVGDCAHSRQWKKAGLAHQLWRRSVLYLFFPGHRRICLHVEHLLRLRGFRRVAAARLAGTSASEPSEL